MRAFAHISILLVLLVLIASPAAAQNPIPEDPLRHELDELRARIHDLEGRLDDYEAHAVPMGPPPAQSPPSAMSSATPPPTASGFRFRFDREGFAFGTADRTTEVRLRLILQLDGHVYVGGTTPMPDTFLIRRARPYIDGTLFGIIDFRLMAELGPNQPILQDAYIDLRPWRWLSLRAGKFRIPLGLEWIQNDTTLPLPERSLASNLVPQRDIGVMLSGEVASGTFTYALAILNGAPDDYNAPDFDSQSAKDYFGKIFLHPFRLTKNAAFTHLGFGVAGSYGCANGNTAAPALATYRSPGMQTIFTYLNDTTLPDAVVLAACDRWRVSPQMYWYLGPVGLFAEYVYSAQRVERFGTEKTLYNQAWNVRASFVVTMERASYDGVIPKHPIDFRHKAFGAIELGVRYSELRIDEAAFPLYADAAKSVRTARELAAGVNWYMTENLKLMIAYHRTDFVGGAPLGGDREPENSILIRLQLAF